MSPKDHKTCRTMPVGSTDVIAVGLLLLAAEAAAPSDARAAPPSSPPAAPEAVSPWRFAALGLTELPVDVDVGVRVEGPGRLRMTTGIGFLPSFYVDAINGFLVGIGAYDDATGQSISSALSSSLAWRLHFGWRPIVSFAVGVEI
jgi:hypothetical protein